MQPAAIVTGAGTGIGLAIARALAEEGYRVAGLARRLDVLKNNLPAGAIARHCDVADDASVREAVGEIATEFGRLDALFNCAGIVQRSPLVETDEEDLHRMIGINLMGTVRVTRAALSHLKQSRGCVVNFSSTLTVRPVPGLTLYAASKGGIEAFTRALSIEAAEDGVRVNAILPALVRSDIWRSAGMSDEAYDTLMRERGREYPLGRIGEPEDVADLALYLASSRASWLTGACIPLDGGSGVNSVVR